MSDEAPDARSAHLNRWNRSVFDDGTVVPDPDWTAKGSPLVGYGTWVSWGRYGVLRFFWMMTALDAVTALIYVAGFAWEFHWTPWAAALATAAWYGPLQGVVCWNALRRLAGRDGNATMALVWMMGKEAGVDAFVRAAAGRASLGVADVQRRGRATRYILEGGVQVTVRNASSGGLPILAVRTRGEAGVAAHTRFKGAVMEEVAARRPDRPVAQIADP